MSKISRVSNCHNPGWMIGSVAAAILFSATSFAQYTGERVFSDPHGATDALLGDFNQDGIDDLLVLTNSNSVPARLYLGLQNGWKAPVTLSFGLSFSGQATAIGTGDFNNDGKLDACALTVDATNKFSVALGDGSGGFPTAVHTSNTFWGPRIRVADMNSDGNLDAATCYNTAAPVNKFGIDVLRGLGNGGFVAPVNILPVAGILTFDLMDMNSDGIRDVVALFTTGDVSVQIGNSHMGFSLPVYYPTQSGAKDMAAVDFDLNGKTDIAVAYANAADPIRVYGSNGAGSFNSPTNVILEAPDLGVNEIRAGDVSSDGKPDLVATIYGNRIRAGFGNGAGQISSAKTLLVSSSPRGRILDVNHDGKSDVLSLEVGTPHNSMIQILQSEILGNNGLRVYSAGGSINTRHVSKGDFNGDGNTDLIICNSNSATMWVFLGDGAGNYGPPAGFNSFNIQPTSTAILDINQDGKLDFVIGHNSVVPMDVYLGNGAGGFALGAPIATVSSTAQLFAYDFNKDGREDLLTGGSSSIGQIYYNIGGGFAAPVNQQIADTFTTAVTGIAGGDVDLNGVLDIATSFSNSVNPNGIGVALGTAPGAFDPLLRITATGPGVGVNQPFGISLGDVNQDGLLDAAMPGYSVFSGSSVGLAGVYAGNGTGTFVQLASYNTVVSLRGSSATLADLTSDGILDLAVGNTASGSIAYDPYVYVAYGVQGGAFSTFDAIANYGEPYDVISADLNADGRGDLISSSPTIHLNVGDAPTGVSLFAKGTPGCLGRLGMGVNRVPQINQPAFALTATNTPASTLGLGIATDVQDVPGTDLFGLGFLCHFSFLGAQDVFTFDLVSTPQNTAAVPAPIPNDVNLVNRSFYIQSIWLESGTKCNPASSPGLISSRPMTVTIQ